ncbi:hypothetical protein [Sulfitobacter aestuariivivens]|uniref:hypothetical protein n=1 Tax=Sulfitobacter aestuariivivens TaxID=2766981 RepID=UPI0031B60DEE
MPRIVFGLLAAVLLAACSVDQSPDAPDNRVAAAAFRDTGPKTLTIMTMVNNRTGSGGHTSMLIKGSQSVLFDPAGSFRAPSVVERGDVIFGASPGLVRAYKSSHARASHHVVTQEIPVTDAQAEQALQLAVNYGAVPGAFCANATTDILRQVQGFSSVNRTYYPVKFMEQVATFPGVRTSRLYENDAGDVIDAVRAAELATLE